MCFAVVALAGVGLAVVVLRAEQTRCASGVMALESRWVQQRRTWWGLQTRVARLRTPERMRPRFETLPVEPFDPGPERSPVRSARLAVDRP